MIDNNIILVENKRDFTNTVSVSLMFKGGSFSETKENCGIGNLFADVWLKSNKILEISEYFGGNIDVKIGGYFLEVTLSSPTEHIDKLIEYFENFLVNPIFDEAIFNREKANRFEEIKAIMDNPNSVAKINFYKAIYKGYPYELSSIGTEETIENISLEDVKTYYKENILLNRMKGSIVGNYSENTIKNINTIISKLDLGDEFNFPTNKIEFKENYIEEINQKIKQAKLMIAYDAPTVGNRHYEALKVLNDILGGGMSSRYFKEIRKNSSYAYSVNSAYPSQVSVSRFIVSAGLDYNNVQSAIDKISEINKNLAKTLTDSEIEKAKKSIVGSILIDSQKNSRIAWQMSFFETNGLGADYYNRYISNLKNIKKENILEAAEYLNKNKVVYVLKPDPNSKVFEEN